MRMTALVISTALMISAAATAQSVTVNKHTPGAAPGGVFRVQWTLSGFSGVTHTCVNHGLSPTSLNTHTAGALVSGSTYRASPSIPSSTTSSTYCFRIHVTYNGLHYYSAITTIRMIPAFPGAEGFGAISEGGRAGKVVIVNSLSDLDTEMASSTVTTLREALMMTEPRTIVFSVSGTITLNKGSTTVDAAKKVSMGASQSGVTVAGQTAPGGGICIAGYPIEMIGCTDVVFRHVRFRPGGPSQGLVQQPESANGLVPEGGNRWLWDCVRIAGGSRRVIFDHCSLTWSGDEIFEIDGAGTRDVSFQWCIIAEALQTTKKVGSENMHNLGPMIRGGASFVTLHHNYIAHNRYRNPLIQQCNKVELVNNLHFDTATHDAHIERLSTSDPVCEVDVVGSVFRRGPTTENTHDVYLKNLSGATNGSLFSIYVGDCLSDDFPSSTDTSRLYLVTGTAGMTLSQWQRNTRLTPPAYPVTVDLASNVAGRILAAGVGAGATKPALDSVDARLRNNFSAAIRDWRVDENNVTYPILAAGTVPADFDKDGMPDTWEQPNAATHGTNWQVADDFKDGNGDGYSNLENYLNSLAP